MTPKIQKIIGEIEKTRARIAESQERLRELERQKTELENTEIVALFRSLDVAPDELPDFIAAMKRDPALPVTEAVRQEAVAGPAPYPAYQPAEEDADNEE